MKPDRKAGVTVPLFSLRGARSWGIGEILDLPEHAAWLAEAGVGLVQLLPLGEIAGGDTSPYSAITALGIDPMFISPSGLADLPDEEVPHAIGHEGLARLERARASRTVDYGAVRALKRAALAFAFERFVEREANYDTARAKAFVAFTKEHAHWLDDYALYRALKDAHAGRPWYEWKHELAERDARALHDAETRFAKEIAFYRYLQWVAHEQWGRARAELRAMGVEVMGDLPFQVSRDSADVWANPTEFDGTRAVGAPPDQFDEDGQDWGLPPYAWEQMRKNDFAWLRRRCRYTASLYDRFRIDHLVGFYRTYSRPLEARRDARGKLVAGTFHPSEPDEVLAHGERVITAMRDAAAELGGELVAEDLGIVPPPVRASLAKLGVPGYKVLIWEKDGETFRDPSTYPANSVTCFGTHDTDPVRVWWETREAKERTALLELPALAARKSELGETFTPNVHRALLDLLNGAPSRLALFLVQDLLGATERINTPATVGAHNWTYRLPGTVAEMRATPAIVEALTRVGASVRAAGRIVPTRA